MPYSRSKKPTLEQMMNTRRLIKADILRGWQVKTLHTQAEIDYFLLFIVDKYYAVPSRRAWYVQAWAVESKISHFKSTGEWPLEPRYNQHFLTMFKLAYHFPE